MVIDWLYLICLIFFFIRGYKKGLLMGVFSVLAVIIGFVAATQLSGTIANALFKNNPSTAKWTPLLVYLIVFLLAAGIVRLVARLLQDFLKSIAMGWLNRLLGLILYGLLITFLFSLFLWIFNEMGVISPNSAESSKTYPFLISLAPNLIDVVGKIIPLIKDGFEELELFFNHLNGQIINHT